MLHHLQLLLQTLDCKQRCFILMQDLQSIPHGRDTQPHNVHMELERKLVKKHHDQARRKRTKRLPKQPP
jgi:hypothetical protein